MYLYLLNEINNIVCSRVPGQKIIGALDMGGSSNQLILYNAKNNAHSHGDSPNERPVAHDDFWSHSWLHFGVERVQQKVVDFLFVNHTAAGSDTVAEVISNPCAFAGFETGYDGDSKFTMRGTGQGALCLEAIRKTLWGDLHAAEKCLGVSQGEDGVNTTSGAGCGVDGVQSPQVSGHDFFAMSVYFYAFDCVRHLLADTHDHFTAW